MRRLLQLRTSQGSNGDQPDLDRVSAYQAAMRRQAAPDPVSRSPNRDGPRSRRQGQPQAGRRSVRAAALWIRRRAPGRCRARRHQRHAASPSPTDSFVVKPLRFPGRLDRRTGGERHGERSGRLGRAAPKLWWSPSCSKPGLPTPVLEAEVRAMAKAARDAGVRIAAATPKSSNTAKPTRCTSPPPALAACFMA